MENLLKTFLDILYPPSCVGCGRFGKYFCRECLQDIKCLGFGTCIVCGKPSLKGFTHGSCSKASTPERLTSPFVYGGVVQKAIHRAKYSERSFHVLKILTEMAVFSMSESSFDVGRGATIVPVPLHKNRYFERGFNQSEVIANVLAEKFDLKSCASVLTRIRKTVAQANLKGAERGRNVRGAFKADGAGLSGRDILLVDDVCTTGSTLLECAKVLKGAGARFVWCFVLARAL